MADTDHEFKKVKTSGDDKKKAKYGDDANNFSVKNSGIENGIVRNRKMTDILMLTLFFAFIVAMGFCTAYGLKNGQVEKLMAPLDGNDHFCG